MAALLGKMDMRATAFKERMEDLDDFMHQENLPLDLRFRTRAFFEYGYNHSRDIPTSINELSKSLQTEVALHLYHDLITAVPFFCDCGKDFLTEVILLLKAQTLSPGDYLYEAGEYGDSMFFLVKGSVEVVLDSQNGVFAELKEGSYFGESCVLGISTHRPVSVRAMSWCNIFCLGQDALEDCITHHPEAQDHFVRLAQIQTAEKTVRHPACNLPLHSAHSPNATGWLLQVTKAASRLQGIRDGTASADEEAVAKSASIALGNTGKHDDPFGGKHPPVVIKALRRAQQGQREKPGRSMPGRGSIQGGGGDSLYADYGVDEEMSAAFADEIIQDLNKQQAQINEVGETLPRNHPVPLLPPSHLSVLWFTGTVCMWAVLWRF